MLAETLAGRHEDHMLFVIDEASGIPEAVFKPIEKTLTGKLNLVFMIYNPTRNNGFAIDSQGKSREFWVTLHWDALSSENVTRTSIENLAKYGIASPAYRIGVLGLPPLADSDSLIPYEWIMEARGRELDIADSDPVMFGCDVGGGGDRSVICHRQGGVVVSLLTSNSKDTMDTTDWIAQEMDTQEAAVAFIDVIGIGKGVYDRLRQMKYTARPADSRGKPSSERFFNARAEMYWTLREQFEHKCISIPDNKDLIDELGAIKGDFGKVIKIREKKELRRALGFSPDLADALAMSYFKPDSLFRKLKGKTKNVANMTGVFLR